MAFLEQSAHQALVDELRTADITRITEIALELTNNYTNVITDDTTSKSTIADLTAKNAKYQQQNNELFLAATAHARFKEDEKKESEKQQKQNEQPKSFLEGMFDNRGNLIINQEGNK